MKRRNIAIAVLALSLLSSISANASEVKTQSYKKAPKSVFETNLLNDVKDKTYKYMYATDTLNIRKYPSSESEVITTVQKGSKLAVSDYNNIWYVVHYDNDKYYYVSKSYMTNEEPKQEEKPKSIIDYTKEDLSLLAHLVYAEAGGEGYDEMLRVGSVVLNRMNGNSWWSNGKRTIKDVIYRKGQYQCTWNGHIKKAPSDEAWGVAKNLLENGSQMPSNVCYQSSVKQGSGVYLKSGKIYYCYE
jgi:uncharacterized protein YgiM (DUF1202 family)